MVGLVNLARHRTRCLSRATSQCRLCMVPTLSHRKVHFFQASTEELVNEWVSRCNYWAARQSKEPLTGVVSRMEQGWNRANEPPAHDRSVSDDESTRIADLKDNMKVRSGRSSRSTFGWKNEFATVHAPGELAVGGQDIHQRLEAAESVVCGQHARRGHAAQAARQQKALRSWTRCGLKLSSSRMRGSRARRTIGTALLGTWRPHW